MDNGAHLPIARNQKEKLIENMDGYKLFQIPFDSMQLQTKLIAQMH